jgi:hypothetical protein
MESIQINFKNNHNRHCSISRAHLSASLSPALHRGASYRLSRHHCCRLLLAPHGAAGASASSPSMMLLSYKSRTPASSSKFFGQHRAPPSAPPTRAPVESPSHCSSPRRAAAYSSRSYQRTCPPRRHARACEAISSSSRPSCQLRSTSELPVEPQLLHHCPRLRPPLHHVDEASSLALPLLAPACCLLSVLDPAMVIHLCPSGEENRS